MIHDVDPNLNLGDIAQVDEKKLNNFDLMTWGFPCTDLSAAGRQKVLLMKMVIKLEVECIMKV